MLFISNLGKQILYLLYVIQELQLLLGLGRHSFSGRIGSIPSQH